MTAESEYQRIEDVISYLLEEAPRQPPLAELASRAGVSESHLLRTFQRWAGVTPKQFARFLTLQYAKERLQRSESILRTAHGVGLSGPGRLHDLFVTVEAMTPADYRRGGEGVEIRYGVHDSPFGLLYIATTPRGICELNFLSPSASGSALPAGRTGGHRNAAVAQYGWIPDRLGERWPGATIVHDQSAGEEYVARIFHAASAPATAPLPVLLKGTNFQINVWRALLGVPFGELVSYSQLAALAGVPDAVRATGTAVGENPVVFLIPCHRVIRKSGDTGNYGGGVLRKRAILVWEGIRGQQAGQEEESTA